jgi:hypothetical protein
MKYLLDYIREELFIDGKMPTDKEIKRIELATVYEIRLMLTSKDKKEYTTAELLEILDQYARDKNTPV